MADVDATESRLRDPGNHESSQPSASGTPRGGSALKRIAAITKDAGSALWNLRPHIPDLSPADARLRRNLVTVGGAALGITALFGLTGCRVDFAKGDPTPIDTTRPFSPESMEAIKKASRSALSIRIYRQNEQGAIKKLVSGFLLKPNLGVSVGHGLRDPVSGKIWNPSDGGTIVGGTVSALDRHGNPVEKFITRTSSILDPNEDLSVLEVDSEFSGVETIQISKRQPQIGDRVACIDYGPDGNDTNRLRSPNAKDDPEMKVPAIYEGIYVGDIIVPSGSRCPVLMTFKNLGEGDPEEGTRQGSSGGVVVNENGEAVGTLLSIESPDTVDNIEKELNVTLTMSPEDRQKTRCLTIFQPITDQKVNELEAKLRELPKSGIDANPNSWAAPAPGRHRVQNPTS